VADKHDVAEILALEKRHDVANVCRQRDRFGEGAGLRTQTGERGHQDSTPARAEERRDQIPGRATLKRTVNEHDR
jgi:hypothetical protein